MLETCPHHSTLLHLLLEVSLSRGLEQQSQFLLFRLLQVALQPQAATSSPRIVASAHSTFLTTLLSLCGDRCIHDRSFVSILVTALSDAPQSAWSVCWGCKAVRRLARRVLSRDITAFTILVEGIIRAATDFHTHSVSTVAGGMPADLFTERLAKWLEALCQRVFEIGPSADLLEEHLQELVRLTQVVSSLQLPHLESSIDNALCIATLTLSALGPEAKEVALLVKIIRKVPPRTSTFTKLISLACGTTPDFSSPGSTALAPFSAAIHVVRGWAASLRARRCFVHEASLWSTALSYLETLCSAHDGLYAAPATHDFETMRDELVGLVEQAETRSFGGASIVDSPSVATPRKDPQTAQKWRWEELFDCWVVKTPATSMPAAGRHQVKRTRHAVEGPPVKRRRTDMGPPARPRASSQLRPALGTNTTTDRPDLVADSEHASSSSSSSIASLSSQTPAISAPPVRRGWPILDYGDEDGDDLFDERVPASPTPTSRKPVRRVTIGPCEELARVTQQQKSTPFRTLIADAMKNRVVLHTGYTPRKSCLPSSRRLQSRFPVPAEMNFPPSSPTLAFDTFSSDDALDLLAHSSSDS